MKSKKMLVALDEELLALSDDLHAIRWVEQTRHRLVNARDEAEDESLIHFSEVIDLSG